MSTDFVSLFTGMSERDIGYILKNMVQRSINEELTNVGTSTVDNKTPVLITNSKDVELMNDISISSVINIEPSTTYLMPEEPDGKDLKVWLKFQNAGELRDWSYQKNKSFSVGSNTMPGLFFRGEDHNMLKNELYSYFNGLSHYAYTIDAPQVRINPNIAANKITSFFMRLIPVSLAKLLYAENNSLFTKVDDDQLRYGYSVTLDSKGNINFYIKNDYRQYHLLVKDAYANILTDPLYANTVQYRFENFNKRNFMSNYEFLCGLVAHELPFDDWFFKYNPSTHNMSVIRTTENNSSLVFADTSLIIERPYLSCPIQEGKWTHTGTIQNTIYDNSGNNNNGTISGQTTGGLWNDDNTLTSTGPDSTGGLAIDFAGITALNTLTEFSISFWFNPSLETTNNKAYNTRLVTKGYAAADTIYIERTTALNDIKFAFRFADNIEQSVTFSNPFPTGNTWYFITARWKSGEKLKLTVNNIEVQSSSIVTGTLSTATNTLKLFSATTAPTGIMALFKMWNTRISDTKRDELYYTGYHNPLFPKSEDIQPVAEEEPDDIFIPFSNVYTLDKMTTPSSTDYRKINSLAGDNPLVQIYSVADGISSTDPEVQHMQVPDGVSTGGGVVAFTEIYTCTDPSNNSSSQLDGNNLRTVVELQTGSTLIGKRVTKAIFYLKGVNSPTGTVHCKIWNAAGTQITELWLNGTTSSVLNAASVNTSTHTAYTFQNTDLTPWGANSLAVGWRIGIEYSDGSSGDEIDVKRNRANPRTTEWNGNYDGSWATTVDDDDLVGNLFEGGTGTPVVEPWYVLSNSYIVGELFGSTASIKTKKPTRVRFKVKRNASATAGTLSLQILTSSNALKSGGTLTTWPISGLTTSSTGADITWQNVNQAVTIESGEQLVLTATGMPTGGTVSVMTNLGNNTTSDTTKNYNSTTSYLRKRTATTWSSDTSSDISGDVYSGGSNFDAFIRTSSTLTRVATKAVNSSSSIHNKKVTKVIARIKKVGAPTGVITARIRDSSDVQRVLFSSVDVSTITADSSYHDVEFTNFTHTYLMNSATGSGDKVVYEFTGSDSSNYLEFNANADVFDTATLSTITQTYNGINYTDDAQHDLAGKMYSGGEPDLNSRTRVAQSIEHQDSRLKGKKITRVKQYLYRTTVATTGTVTCNIMRGSDDSLVKTLGSGVSVSTLSTTASAPTLVTFEDTTNNYPMTIDDKVSIQFTGGSATDAVGVLVRSVTPNYDGSFSFIRKYDEIDWDDEETTYDLCATMDEGGFFFTPDPNSIPDPTPVNDKDLIFAAGNNKKSGFFEAFLMEFRIYTKDISLDQAGYLYQNRYSISPIAPNAILMPFSFRANTLDPV